MGIIAEVGPDVKNFKVGDVSYLPLPLSPSLEHISLIQVLRVISELFPSSPLLVAIADSVRRINIVAARWPTTRAFRRSCTVIPFRVSNPFSTAIYLPRRRSIAGESRIQTDLRMNRISLVFLSSVLLRYYWIRSLSWWIRWRTSRICSHSFRRCQLDQSSCHFTRWEGVCQSFFLSLLFSCVLGSDWLTRLL